MTVGELGELGLLRELERRGLVHGIEHDAAEVDGLVVTQDALVEGVHFRFDLISWRGLGFRAAAVNISDLANFKPVLRRGVAQYRELYQAFHEARNAVETI